MIPVPSGVRVWLAGGRTDMRRYVVHTNMLSRRGRTRVACDGAVRFSQHNHWSTERHVLPKIAGEM
jgi:guanyl-specific ribonuclease Sa